MKRSKHVLALFMVVALVGLLVMPASGMAIVKPTTVEPQTDYSGRPDPYESRDDSATTAPRLPEVTIHNFDTDEDVDWSIISAETTGQPFVIETVMLDGTSLDTEIHIFERDGSTFSYPTTGDEITGDPSNYSSSGFYQGTDEVDYSDDSDLWGSTYSSTVYFQAPHPGTFYVLVRMNDTEETGRYAMRISKGIASRIAGADRYETAAAVSHMMWSNTHIPSYGTGYGPDYCVVANGLDFADALSGSALAMPEGTSMLLTKRDVLPEATAAEIERLSATTYWDEEEFTVYVLGGPSSVSQAVVNKIKSLGHVSSVVRVAGADRFSTATAIADETSKTVGSFDDVVFVVNGLKFPDALAAGPVAAEAQAPILFTRQDSVPAATLDYLKTHFEGADVYVVGSTASISAGAESAIKTAVGASATVTRVGGVNRYATARALAQLGVDEFGLYGDSMTLVSGAGFADGLAAASISFWTEGPLLLTTPKVLAAEVTAFAKENGPTVYPSYVVGGAPSVSPAAYESFKKLWKLFPYEPPIVPTSR